MPVRPAAATPRSQPASAPPHLGFRNSHLEDAAQPSRGVSHLDEDLQRVQLGPMASQPVRVIYQVSVGRGEEHQVPSLSAVPLRPA
jgi:hypothetical protein